MNPDGWHTYHICGGLLRELVWSGHEVLCVYCGQWCEVRIIPAQPIAHPEADGSTTEPEAVA